MRSRNWALVRVLIGSMRAQLQMTRQDIEDLFPLITMPLFSLVFIAILVHSGRTDLAGYALVAPMLMTVGQMGFFVASELVVRERFGETLELVVATPAPFFLVLVPRIAVLTSLGLLGFAEAWLIARVVFGLQVTIHHPGVFAAAMLLTTFAATGTSVVTAALFCLGTSVRTFQNSINYPLYLLGGVLVPVTFLPDWVQPFSRLVYFYWSANLLRDSMQAVAPENVLLRLSAIFILGTGGAIGGGVLLRRMLDHLRHEGTLGLA